MIAPKEPKVRSSDAEFARAKEVVRARSLGICERCKRARAVQTHHRRPRGMGGTQLRWPNLPASLVDLCVACHNDIESHRTIAYETGWLIHQGQATAVETPIRWWFRAPHNTWVQRWVLLDNFGDAVRISEVEAKARLGVAA